MHNILIIDDEYNNIVNQFLELEKFNFDLVLNINDLKETVLNRKIDLILCRIDLKKYDGFYIIQLFYSMFNKKIPFILYRENCSYIEFRKGMELGADDVINFPVDSNSIKRTITKRLLKIYSLKQVNI